MLSSDDQEHIDAIRNCINSGYGKHNTFGQWEHYAGTWEEQFEEEDLPRAYGMSTDED